MFVIYVYIYTCFFVFVTYRVSNVIFHNYMYICYIYIYDLFLPPYAFSYYETKDKDFSTRVFVVNPGVSMDSMWSEH